MKAVRLLIVRCDEVLYSDGFSDELMMIVLVSSRFHARCYLVSDLVLVCQGACANPSLLSGVDDLTAPLISDTPLQLGCIASW